MENILLIDKPKGITSFDCIRILRRKLGIRKMGHANSAPSPAGSGNANAPTRIKIGHAGTLDPMATGLMIIGVGDGTKSLGQYLKLPKTYEADIALGLHTDTGDITGRELPISNFQFPINLQDKKFSSEEIEKTLQTMVGKLELPVPAFSAIKQGGEALYKKARRGEAVDTPIKTMEVTSVEFLGVSSSPPQLRRGAEGGVVVSARFSVSSGTYIRSLAEEFSRRLGVPATLAGLRRTRIGEFKIEDAEKI